MKQRNFIICHGPEKDGLFYRKSFEKLADLRDALFKFEDTKVAYIAYRDDEDIASIHAIAVYNTKLKQQIRTRQQAYDQLLQMSVQGMVKAPHEKVTTH